MIRQLVIKMNFPGLKLPDGRVAETLDRDELSRELRRLEIPGIENDMGKVAMLAAYEMHRDSLLAAIPYNAAADFHKATQAKA